MIHVNIKFQMFWSVSLALENNCCMDVIVKVVLFLARTELSLPLFQCKASDHRACRYMVFLGHIQPLCWLFHQWPPQNLGCSLFSRTECERTDAILRRTWPTLSSSLHTATADESTELSGSRLKNVLICVITSDIWFKLHSCSGGTLR